MSGKITTPANDEIETGTGRYHPHILTHSPHLRIAEIGGMPVEKADDVRNTFLFVR